jgi:cytochrome c6
VYEEETMTRKQLFRYFMVFVFFILTTGVASAGDPMKGSKLYADHCSGCHGVNGTPQVVDVPNFKMGQGLMKSDQQLLTFIKNGKLVMPGYKGLLSDQEILDIIAHLRTLF